MLIVDRCGLRRRLNVKRKPSVLSCACGFKKNYMLHSVTMGSLVDLENKWQQKLCKSVTGEYISAKYLVQGLNIVASLKKPFKWSFENGLLKTSELEQLNGLQQNRCS